MSRTKRMLFGETEGIALIEFAMVVPVLLVLVFASVELARWILIVQKVDKATYVLTDLVGQYKPASITGDINAPGHEHDTEIGLINLEKEVLTQVDDMLAPFVKTSANNYGIMLTSVQHSGTTDRIRWQVVSNNWRAPKGGGGKSGGGGNRASVAG